MNTNQMIAQSIVANQWKKIGIKDHHGINVPLFSLHSKKSCGIGEFPDLLPLISWCKSVGMDLIQLLPLNDTGPETSPYSAISAFALNPIHLGLSDLPNVDKHSSLREQIKELQKENDSSRVNYHKVRPAKYLFLREYHHLEGKKVVQSKEYQDFIDKNSWLTGYALFKSLKVSKRWRPWREWEPHICPPQKEIFQRLSKEFQAEIEFHIFLQFLSFNQFKAVSQYAREQKVFLKGDIPILLSPESVDVWLNSDLFLFDQTVGSPPDMYSPDGQNWGSPIYNWSYLKKTNYSWWKERLQVAEQFYDIYRLDHIIGFFRMWAIPPGKGAKNGAYKPEDQNQWVAHGEEIIKAITQSSTMLPIGEDLGSNDVPQSIRDCMMQLGVCGTKVNRWERKETIRGPFRDPKKYPPISMTTVSTHDSQTNHQWWRDAPDEVEELVKEKKWDYLPTLSSEYQFELLKDSHTSNSLFHINLLQEYLALFDDLRWDDIDIERINYPGIVSEINWSSRYRPSVEELTEHTELSQTIKRLSITFEES